MKRLLLVVVLACVSWSSLPQASSKTQEDTLKTSASEIVPIAEDTLRQYENFKKTIQLSKKNKEFKTLGEAYIGLAQWHEDHTVLDSSIVYLKKAISVYEKQEMTKELAETYLLLVTNYSGTAEYHKGSETVFKALTLYEKLGDQQGVAQCYTKYATCFIIQTVMPKEPNTAKRPSPSKKKMGMRKT